jgi:aspartyl-tRNA(Asn)/glutamyl-tRNA(Gln) amidotransferase subunit A
VEIPKSLSALHQGFNSGAFNCESLVRHYLKQIEQQQHLNAFLEVFAEEATERAIVLDKKKESGQTLGPLFGLVISIKDNICYKDHKVSASSKILENFVSLYSSTVVERLLAADAIIIGRTNCDEFAMGSSNEKSATGKSLILLMKVVFPADQAVGQRFLLLPAFAWRHSVPIRVAPFVNLPLTQVWLG